MTIEAIKRSSGDMSKCEMFLVLLAFFLATVNTEGGFLKKLPPRMMETFKYFHRRPFRNSDDERLKLQGKVLLTSQQSLKANGTVTALPLGIFYGCGGFYTKFKGMALVLQIACVYN
ncbi:hypothetical protein OSTOST_05252 [Ostertagia ostertagi]